MIHFIRHAESNGNVFYDQGVELPAGFLADNLSFEGQAQALRLASEFPLLPYDKILCSPLNRAVQTIAPALAKQGRRAEIVECLAEIPLFSGLTDARKPWESVPLYLDPQTTPLLNHFDNISASRPRWTRDEGELMQRMRDVASVMSSTGHFLVVSHANLIRKLSEFLVGADSVAHMGNCRLLEIVEGSPYRIVFQGKRII